MQKKIQIVDRRSGQVVDQVLDDAKSSVSPPPGSDVRIAESRGNVAGYERDGLDLVITFADGTTLRIENYYDCPVEKRGELVFVDQDTGDAWRAVPDDAACYPAGDTATAPASFHYEPIGVAEAGMGWLLPALLTGGVGIGVIAIANDGGDDKAPPPPPPADTDSPDAPNVNPSNGATLSGTAEAGSTVKIDIDGDGQVDLTTTADAQGNWSVTPTTVLPTGTKVTVTATDSAGNTSGHSETTVDGTPPSPPVVNPTGGATISGTAEPGSTISVDTNGDGTPDYTTVTDPDGTWTITPTTPIPDGTTVDVVATDPTGNSSDPTSTTIDSTPPAIAIIGPIQGDGIVNAVEAVDGLVVNGTTDAEDGQTVTVMLANGPDTLTLTATASGGTWSVALDPAQVAALGNGTVTVSAGISDLVGNAATPATYSFTIDTGVPTAPTLDGAIDNVGSVTGPVSPGGATDDHTPTVTGSGVEPGSTVNLYDGPTLIGTTTADVNGDWSVTPTAPLADGDHSLTTSVVDAAGNESPRSTPLDLTVNTVPPVGAPVIDSVIDDSAPLTGVIANGAATNDTTPTLSGSGADPGATVNIYDHGVFVGTAIADGTGVWSFTPVPAILPGSHSFTVANVDGAGNEGPQSTPYDITIDTVAPTDVPGIGDATDDVGTVSGPIASGGSTDDTMPTLNGTGAEPNGTVNIYNNGTLIGTAPVDGTGAWSYTPASPLGDGDHSLTVSSVDAAGNEGPQSTTPYDITVDTSAPAAPSFTTLTDDVGAITGAIVGTITDDDQPTFSGGGAEPNSTVNIYDNGALIGSTTSNGAGDWSFTPTLSEGPHSLTATVVDAAGNESTPTTAIGFGVDTTAPAAAPTITGVDDDTSPVTGAIGNGGVTNDTQPAFNGAGAEPNSTVNIYQDGTLLGTTTASATGAWAFTPAAALLDGSHSFTVSSVDAAGNESPESAAYTLTIDTVAPVVAPVIGQILDDIEPSSGPVADGGTSNDTQPTLSGGGAEPDATVNIYDNGVLIGTADTDGTGAWSFTPDAGLADGPHSFTASSVDAAGNEGPQSAAPYAITIDTQIPSGTASIDSISDDTGASASDFVTSDSSLTLFGHLVTPLASGETLQVSTDGGTTWTDIVPSGTNWSYDDPRALTDGSYEYQTQILSASGIPGASTTQTVTVDTTNPDPITIQSMTDDTGASALDFITSSTGPLTLLATSGTLGAGETAQITFDGGTTWIDMTGAGTTWSYTDARSFTDGSYTYQVRTIDLAGNSVTSAVQTVTVDTTAPGLITIDAVSTDTGDLSTDFLTSDTTLTLTGHLSAALAAGETAEISIDGGTTWITLTDVTGTDWSYDDARVLTDGSYDYQVRTIDIAGNTGPIATQTVTVDTTLPNELTGIHIIDSIDPTRGDIADTTITNDSSPEIAGTGAEPNSIVNVYNGEPGSEVLIGTTRADASGNWSFIPTDPLADNPVPGDPYAWSVSNVDAAGVEGNKSAPIHFRVDTQNPADSTIDAITGDSGASATDFVTNDPTVTLSGHFSQALTGNDTARISFDGGATWEAVSVDGTGLNWTYTPAAPLADGTYFYEVVVTDAADNVGQSDTQKVVIDTTAPDAITISSIDVDSGASATDFITSDTSIVVNGTLAAPLAIDEHAERAQISIDGGTSWIDLTVTGTNWSYTDIRTLSDGPVEYQVRIIDLAGNVGPVSTQTVTIDTTAPMTPSIVSINDDTGAVGDFVTADTSLTINGTLPGPLGADETLQITTDGGASWINVAPTGSTWSYTDGRTLTDGSYSYQARIIDLAGNITISPVPTVVTVDTSAPTATILIDSITNDTGTSSSDFLTSYATPTILGHLGTALGAGETAEISLDGGSSWAAVAVVGTGWSYATTSLAEGANTVIVRVIDASGNAGPTDTQVVTIDSTAPSQIALIDYFGDDAGTVVGNQPGGSVTDDTSPLLHGQLDSPAEAGQVVHIYEGTTLIATVALTAGDLDWTYSGLTGLAEGTHTYTVRVVDDAGNEGASSPDFGITVNTTPPEVTTLTIDDIDTDTWYNSAVSSDESLDFVTRDTALTVSGVADVEAGSTVQISSDGGTTWTNVALTGANWSYADPTERTSNVTYQLRVVDDQGNVSPNTASHVVYVDVNAPTAGVLAPALSAADDTGTTGDNVTTDLNVTFSSADFGLKEAGATIQLIDDVNNNGIYENGIDVVLASDSGSNTTWSLSTTFSTGDILHLGFVQYDAAGNYSRLSPTSQISVVVGDNHAAGDFTATSVSEGWGGEAAGMGVGIDSFGQLMFTVRRSAITQTSQTTATTENPDRLGSEIIANNTFLDYNRDGNLDYMTSSNDWGPSTQTIYVGQADGTHIGDKQAVGAWTASGGVVAFDKEGDGYLDLVWGDWGNDNPAIVSVVNTDGTLAVDAVTDVGVSITQDREVSGVDIDNDGDIDLALHTYSVNGVVQNLSLTVLSNDGSGVYSVSQTTANIFNNSASNGSDAVSMTWADFDGDGDLDLYLNRTTGSDVSGIYTNTDGMIGATKTAIGDIGTAQAGSASIAMDWNHDGKMDVVEFSRATTNGPIQLYLNTGTAGALAFSNTPITLATGQSNIGGVAAADYDWDGDVDIVYQTANDGAVKSIANTNQVQDGTALHLRIVDQNGVNSYYGNTLQLFDSAGNLVATQILNAQSGVGTNDSTGIVNFYNLDPNETYTATLLRTVNGVSQDIGGVASLSDGAAALSTIENVNASWTGLTPGASNSGYVLSGESDAAVNDGNFAGTGYNDVFHAGAGNDSFAGGGGWSLGLTGAPAWSADGGMDIVDYGAAGSLNSVDLANGQVVKAGGTDILTGIEGIRGSAGIDNFNDGSGDNLFEGRGGNDTFALANGGHDVIVYKMLDAADATGGNGADAIAGFTVGALTSTASADILDLRSLLQNYTGTANTYRDVTTGANVLDYASNGLTEYLNVVVVGNDTLIQVDINGTGIFTTVSTLQDVQTSLADLLANQQLWVASSETGHNIAVTSLTTTDTTPIVTGTIPFALDNGAELRVIVNGVTYSSDNPGQVVVDPLNQTWYVQIPTALATGTYNVTAAIFNDNGAVAMQDVTARELVVNPEASISFGGAGGAANKATAMTIGENGAWRIFSNDTIYDSNGTSSSSLGSFGSQSITVAGQQTQNVTFMDYNRDGHMDVMGIDQSYGDGQQSWTFDGTNYVAFQVGGSGNTSATVFSWYGGVMAYDKNGDGYVDLVYGDNTPNDAEAGGGYDTAFVVNDGGVFIKDANYVMSNTGSPAPTNTGNAAPDKEVSGVDLNNDGTVDVVYHATNDSNAVSGEPASNNVRRLVAVDNSGDGALNTTQVLDDIFVNEESLTSYVPSMTWADFNGDGYMDLFLARGATNDAGTGTASEISRIHYNDGGTLVSSITGPFATTYLGDTLSGGASFAVDWNADGRMDAIELPRFTVGPASSINLYTNESTGSFVTSSLAAVPANGQITGGVMLDLDWDGDRDLIYFRASGATGYVQNNASVAEGTSLHLRIVDSSGINVYFGNTVQLFDSAGNLVASQIINPQSGNQTNDSSALVDFHGLDADETYSAVLLRNVNGFSSDVGGLATAGANPIENVNASWNGLTPAGADHAYVLTAEPGNSFSGATGVGIVGTGYNDTFFATMGGHVYNGGGGSHDGAWSNTGGEDILDFKLATNGVTVDLSLTTAQNTGWGTVTLQNIEGVTGSQHTDTLMDSVADNLFDGGGGNDTIHLAAGGQDTIMLKLLDAADASGGNGMDSVTGFTIGTYEATPNADRIDLKDLLTGYTGDADGAAHYVNGIPTLDAGETIANFLQVTTSGADTIISVDRDGPGAMHDFTPIVTLNNVHTDLQTLLANHQLVTA